MKHENDIFKGNGNFPYADSARHESVRARCFHPSGIFTEFGREEMEQSIPQRFEKQVEIYPRNIAVKTRKHEFTYDALNRTANRIAHTILERWEDNHKPIALLFEHDAPLLAAILGVLKAGTIYVPLDPWYPLARMIHMLENSGADLIATNSRNSPLARKLAQDKLHVINIEEIKPNLPTGNPDRPISPDDFANILYTSGSTGKPKGVIQSHRNILHEIMNYTNAIHICSVDRMVLVSSCSFSNSVRTVYGALLNGASLYPLDIKAEGLTNLADWLIQQEITTYRSVTTAFQHFASALTGKEEFPDLRVIYLAGESVYKRHVDLYKKHFSLNCIFVDGLGSSEALTYRWNMLDKDTEIEGNNVPVGYALDDQTVLLLDEDRNDVGINCAGEIAIKSRYLSPGYWRRPDLTDDRYLADPEGGEERIYLTGDIGLMKPNGCLLHLGRKDFQVKIRGYRIEVAEIEAALLDLDAIKDAAVVACEDRYGDQRLAAYFISAVHPAPTVTVLRRYLSEKLPDYMVPSFFMALDSMPLNPNGKVDRRAFPTPGTTRPDLETSYIAPRTPVEERLVEIWAHILDLEQVGVNDNFLELGGHSLLATQITSRVLDTFQVRVSIRSLLQSPTVADMALTITQNLAEKAGSGDIDAMLSELETLPDE